MQAGKKNLIQRLHGRGKRVSGQGRWNTLLQLILPSELLVSETLWQARAALIYIGTTCYDTVFYSPPLLLFIIKRGSSRGLTKTIFIDSGEAYFCLMHCLYIGQQSCPSGNKHKMKRHALPVSVCLGFLRMSAARIRLKDIFRVLCMCMDMSPILVGLGISILREKVGEAAMFSFSRVSIQRIVLNFSSVCFYVRRHCQKMK